MRPCIAWSIAVGQFDFNPYYFLKKVVSINGKRVQEDT